MFDEGALLVAPCGRCGAVFVSNPDTVPSVWMHQQTRCPLRPDGTDIVPGEPGTAREPLCHGCAKIVHSAVGKRVPVRDLFPRARLDRIHCTPAAGRVGGTA